MSHFGVLLRVALGMSAHCHVVQHRAVRIKALLLEDRRSASQIALGVGFTYQGHMTQRMQRLFGVMLCDVTHAGKALAAATDTPVG